MGAANDLIVLFLGLETLSLALYVLAASDRNRETSQEAGIKYFVLGGFASAFFLYGIALVYGGTQSTNIGEIIVFFQSNVSLEGQDSIVLAGLALADRRARLQGRRRAVPRLDTRRVPGRADERHGLHGIGRQGRSVRGDAPRARVALPFYRDDWRPVIWVLGVLSLVVGSILAVVQTDVKRMLAYSSISHAGFILVGVEAAGHDAGEPIMGGGMPSVLTYLLLYSVLTVGSFAVVALVGRSNGGDTSLDAFKGLGRRRPALALALTVFLLAQAGVPLTSGFVAKWGVIQAAVEAESYAIAIIAMLAAAIAAFLYLRIMVNTWLEAGDDATEQEAVPFASGLSVVLGRSVHDRRGRVAELAARRRRHGDPVRPLRRRRRVTPTRQRAAPVRRQPSTTVGSGIRDRIAQLNALHPWAGSAIDARLRSASSSLIGSACGRLDVDLGDAFGHQEPSDRLVDALPDRQQAVTAQDHQLRLARAQRRCACRRRSTGCRPHRRGRRRDRRGTRRPPDRSS